MSILNRKYNNKKIIIKVITYRENREKISSFSSWCSDKNRGDPLPYCVWVSKT
jgi:hypothetical protein